MTKKVLVIDDNIAILRVIETKLSNSGLEVNTATNGEEGLQKALTEKPDLVITDVTMPKLDGLGVYQGLQKNPKTQKIPIIFLTALGEEKDEFAELGLTVISKPFSPKALAEKVKTILEGGEMKCGG